VKRPTKEGWKAEGEHRTKIAVRRRPQDAVFETADAFVDEQQREASLSRGIVYRAGRPTRVHRLVWNASRPAQQTIQRGVAAPQVEPRT
jgi:hypothetical protein